MFPSSGSMYSGHCSHSDVSVALCCVNMMPDLKSQLQALWLQKAAFPSVSLGFLYRELKALQNRHLNVIMLSHSADINVAIFHSHSLQSLIEVLYLSSPHFIWFSSQEKEYLDKVCFVIFWRGIWAVCGQFYRQQQTAAWWRYFASPQQQTDETLHWIWFSVFPIEGERAFLTTRQFEREAGGLSRWVEMNYSTLSVWVPSASQDLIVSECGVHLVWPSLAVAVCL